MNHCELYFDEVSRLAVSIDSDAVERLVTALVQLRERQGRLFLLGVGGRCSQLQPCCQ